MTTTDLQKALVGVTVGLSVSETSEMVALGVNAAEVQHMTEAVAQHLVAQGSEIVSAHEMSYQARIYIGGRTEAANGRYPSVVEDALSMLETERPLYLSGVIGGAAAQVISALRQAPTPADFGQPQSEDMLMRPKEVWHRFAAIGVAGLARHNGLAVEENEALFKATNMSQISKAVVLGLSRLRTAGRL